MHPDVIVGKGESGTWQGRIPQLSGETVAIRYTLRELLDRLCELLAELLQPGAFVPVLVHPSGPGSARRRARQAGGVSAETPWRAGMA